jgi:NAD(P)-dependent dehydrogenase (short-subunit alcohol dehydrogenase family)
MLDETIITETPPLYGAYGHIGQQTSVPITGNRAKRIIHGALNITTGEVLLLITEQWDEVMGVNLRGAWNAAHAAIPNLLETGGGTIVNVSSVQALASQQNVLAYTVSKHGLIGLTRSMAMDFAKDNIRVNAVCPGTVDTPMLKAAAALDPNPQSVYDACKAMHPIGRIAQPEEIAEVVAFLAHESSSFVTGAVWTVDGGLLTQIGGAPQTA